MRVHSEVPDFRAFKRFGKSVSKPLKIAFDEYGVWDETVGQHTTHSSACKCSLFSPGTPENGLEQFYNLADALAMASWLNVFVRQAEVVYIACIAQSVNVISPLITRFVVATFLRTNRFLQLMFCSATRLFRQTIY